MTAPAEKTAVFRMASMDKLFSTCGFDFADMEELIAELPNDHDMWEAPGFDRVLFHADPSGMAVRRILVVVETLLMFRLSLSVRPFSRLVFESPGFCGGGGCVAWRRILGPLHYGRLGLFL